MKELKIKILPVETSSDAGSKGLFKTNKQKQDKQQQNSKKK